MPNAIRFRRYALVGLTVLLLHTTSAQAALIGLLPASTSVAPGDSILFDLSISELGNFRADSVGAFDIYIDFDASVLSFTGYSLGIFLGDVDRFRAIDVSSGDLGGVVNIAEVSLLSATVLNAAQPGAFILATLKFDVADLKIATTTQLGISSRSLLGDALGAPLALTRLPATNVQVITSTVPASGTLFLLIASLFGWLALRVSATPHVKPM